MRKVKEFQELTNTQQTYAQLNTSKFWAVCSSELIKNSEFMTPNKLLSLVKDCGGPQQKESMVKSILESLRDDTYDIRNFNFNQLAELIECVAESSPQDLPVFKNYLD